MFKRIRSYCLFGIKAVPVSVEVDASQGLPGFTLVGLPDNAVRESRERVVSAIRCIGKVVTGFRTTVNLSPADLRKEGSALDLPLAIGMLVSTGELAVPSLDRYVLVGELSLDGLLKPVRGVLSIAMSLPKDGSVLVIPRANAQEASLVEGLNFICADSLKECVDYLHGQGDVPASNVLIYYMTDGSWFAMRPSGTEPKIKFYFYTESDSDMDEANHAVDEMTEAVNEIVEGIE